MLCVGIHISRIQFELICIPTRSMGTRDYFSAKSEGKVKNDCEAEAGKQVTLRNTRSYFNKVLQAIGSDFALTIMNELAGVD